MSGLLSSRWHRRLWIAALVLLVAVWLIPISNRLTRGCGLLFLIIVWLGLIGICWHRRAIRISLLAITFLLAMFLILPGRDLPAVELLRKDYVAGLQRYEGVVYVWGGESFLGIDCSGLIRRGLVDALFCRGLRTLDASLVRRAFSRWWQDTAANALGQQHAGLTARLFDTPSINQLDHSQILPGDIAVTENGVHVMAYLGSNTWIEADPSAGRVIRVIAPSTDNRWFQTPMTILRWNVLQQ